MIERIYICDGPDCGESVRTASLHPASGFITVTEQGGGSRRRLHFCTWDCVLRYSATIPPADASIPFADAES